MIKNRRLTKSEIEDIVNQSNRDPEYNLKLTQRDPKQAQRVAENLAAMEPVITDLNKAGFAVESISDLRNKHMNYKRAIPILLSWLPKMENRNIKNEIVSTLGTRFAKPIAAPVLIEEFKKAPDNLYFKWTIADSLSFVADDSVYDEIVNLARNKKHGKSREMLILALANMKNPQVIDVLIEFLSDEDMAGYAVMALGKLKAEKAKMLIEPFLQHDTSWIRREAKRTLAKIT